MPRRVPPDPVAELARLIRHPEPGATYVGEFLASHAVALAPVLGLSEGELRRNRERPDEHLVPELRDVLARLRSRADQADRTRRRERSLAAAERLGATTLWSEGAAVLDVELLFGEVLTDRHVKFIAFRSADEFTTTVHRQRVADSARLRRIHVDVAARVDGQGLHVRWKGGRGGYNWVAQTPPAAIQADVLTVPLRRRACAALQRPRGAWLGGVLRELGYVL